MWRPHVTRLVTMETTGFKAVLTHTMPMTVATCSKVCIFTTQRCDSGFKSRSK
jgi:hypothetical protein